MIRLFLSICSKESTHGKEESRQENHREEKGRQTRKEVGREEEASRQKGCRQKERQEGFSPQACGQETGSSQSFQEASRHPRPQVAETQSVRGENGGDH